MRVALLISGYLRSAEKNLENIREKIISKFDHVDVYLHLTCNENDEDMYLNHSNVEKVKQFLNPMVSLVESNYSFYTIEKKNNLYNQWFKFYKLNEIKKQNENYFGKYDLVIKIRPDLFITSDFNFLENYKNSYIYIPKDSKIDRKKLKNINDDYICDIFAYGCSELMDQYFQLYNNLDDLTKSNGIVSETILKKYLDNSKIPYRYLDLEYYVLLSKCNVFAICGDSGSGKTTLGNILSKHFKSSFLLECDRYHKWERGDENWNNFTHLNPDANYLTKMREDIFDLVVGNDVYQVDYDHDTGKFTQKQKIENSENLIVCGLHSLINTNNEIYDLKIFMDTEENLKVKWKILRDTNNRNYTKDKVIKQINERSGDFQKYILPQKENSNIIVNFYEKKNNKLGLKIKISEKLNPRELFDHISLYNPSCEIYVEKKFIVIDFDKYFDCELFDSLMYKTFDFYDYIIYILLYLKKNECLQKKK
jgi:uridine kinase